MDVKEAKICLDCNEIFKDRYTCPHCGRAHFIYLQRLLGKSADVIQSLMMEWDEGRVEK